MEGRPDSEQECAAEKTPHDEPAPFHVAHLRRRTTAFTCRAGCKERNVAKNRDAGPSSATLCSLRLLTGELFDVTRLANCFHFQADAANYDKITMKAACFKANRSFHNARERDHSAELRASQNAAIVQRTW